MKKFKICRQTLTNVWSNTLPKKVEKAIKDGIKNESLKLNSKKKGLDSIYSYKYNLHYKQILKAYYGDLKEKTFKKLYKKTFRYKNSDYFFSLLETRLQTVVFRLHFSSSTLQSKQLITHGHIWVNNKPITYPGYQVKIGDIVEPSPAYRKKCYELLKHKSDLNTPPYIYLQPNMLIGTLTNMPTQFQIPYPKPFRILDSNEASTSLSKNINIIYTNSILYDVKRKQFPNSFK